MFFTASNTFWPSRRTPRTTRSEIGLIHHSDRGVQYACGDYRKLLEANGITASMSRKGNCLDNAPMESFFGALKTLARQSRPMQVDDPACLNSGTPRKGGLILKFVLVTCFSMAKSV